jgi:hypothetical protein
VIAEGPRIDRLTDGRLGGPPVGQIKDPLVRLSLPQQLGQPRDVDGGRARVVFRQYLRLPGFVLVFAGVDLRQRLPVGVPDDIAARHRIGAPRAGKRRDVIRGEEGKAAGRGTASTSLA